MADFVILDKDPLNEIRNIRSVYMTVKNGIAYKRRQYLLGGIAHRQGRFTPDSISLRVLMAQPLMLTLALVQ